MFVVFFFFQREITYLIFLCCRAGPGKIIDVGSLQSALSLSSSTASCDVSNGLDLKFGKEGAQRVPGLNFDLCQRHVPGYKLIYHALTYLRLRATFGASNLFVSLMKAHLVSVSIFYLLSLSVRSSRSPLDLSFLRHVNLSLTCLTVGPSLIQHPSASIMHAQERHSGSRFAYSYLSILWWAGRVTINHWRCTRICLFPLIDEDGSMSIIRAAAE